MGALVGRSGTRQSLSRTSYTVSQWMVSLPHSMSWPFHQPILSDFLRRLSPIHPEIGSTGVFFSTKSFFQPTFTSMLFISLAISSYLACLYAAVSQSILFTPMQICFTPRRLIRRECCLV